MAEMSLGIVETRGYVGLIEASDAMVKAANVKVVKYEKVGGGRLAIAVAGDVGAVRVAVEAGVEAGKRSGDVWATVIANPTPDLSKFLSLTGSGE